MQTLNDPNDNVGRRVQVPGAKSRGENTRTTVPMVRPCAYHEGPRQGTSGYTPEAGQAAHCNTCGSPRGVPRQSRAGMDGGGAV